MELLYDGQEFFEAFHKNYVKDNARVKGTAEEDWAGYILEAVYLSLSCPRNQRIDKLNKAIAVISKARDDLLGE